MVEERLVEGLHAELARFLHDLLDLLHLTLENQVRNQRRIKHDLNGRHASLAIFFRQQALRNQSAQIKRKIHQQLVTALFREEVDNPVDRLIGAVSVQCGQTQVASFGKGNSVIHGVSVADFAHQNHVWRLPQRVL